MGRGGAPIAKSPENRYGEFTSLLVVSTSNHSEWEEVGHLSLNHQEIAEENFVFGVYYARSPARAECPRGYISIWMISAFTLRRAQERRFSRMSTQIHADTSCIRADPRFDPHRSAPLRATQSEIM